MRSNISPISPGELFSILDDTSNQERRRFYRERPELPDRSGMVLLVDGKRLEREIIDLSVHGACFVLAPEDQYVPGQELHVEVRLAGDYARTRLRILHSRELRAGDGFVLEAAVQRLEAGELELHARLLAEADGSVSADYTVLLTCPAGAVVPSEWRIPRDR